jgi:hypothetical protein
MGPNHSGAAPDVHDGPDSSENSAMSHEWQRVQTGVPERNQFRGAEAVPDFDNPRSPREGQGPTHSDAATPIACRGPRVSRPAGVTCGPR